MASTFDPVHRAPVSLVAEERSGYVSTHLTVGVDIGGTKLAAGVVNQEGEVLDRVRCPTPAANADKVLDAVCGAVGELQGRHPGIVAVGVGTAGHVGVDRSTVTFAPNLPWRDEPLRARVTERLGLRTVVENDANAWAWGEARFGAGRGCDHLVCVTLGTGVGGGLVLAGALHRGRYGLAAEVGHSRLVPDGRQCVCGNLGCWEAYASGRALAIEARERAEITPERAATLTELVNGDIGAITGVEVTEAALAGDAVALASFHAVGTWVGAGLANLAETLDPERFVLGGGVAEAGDILLGPTWDAYRAHLKGRDDHQVADIRIAELGPDAALVGAADLARLN